MKKLSKEVEKVASVVVIVVLVTKFLSAMTCIIYFAFSVMHVDVIFNIS